MRTLKHMAFAGFIGGLALNSGIAEAKRNQRTGFNFGTSVRLITTNDRSFGDSDSGINGNSKVNSQSYNPFVAYSNGLLNLGLSAHVESGTTTTVEKNTATNVTVNREATADVKGTSVFGRFLFGKVMFFELGLGIYKQHTTLSTSYTNAAGGGAFNGSTEKHTVDSAGPGYHLGGGLELPIADGFYFTTSYIVRIFQLRDTEGGTFGAKRAYNQKREITFGIEHYLK